MRVPVSASRRPSPGTTRLGPLSDVVFAACLVAVAVKYQFAFSIPSSLYLGSVRIDAQDAVAIAMVALALFGRFWQNVTGVRRVLVAVILVIAVVGAACWVRDAGLQEGMNRERPWIYAFAALAFGIAFARARWQTWRVIVVWISVGIAFIQAFALLFLGWAHGYADPTLAGGNFYGTRPLGAEAALMMVLGMLVALTSITWNTWWRYGIALVLGLSCSWSQNRSVWLSIVVALVVYLIMSVRNRSSRGSVVVAAAVLGALAVVSLVPVATGFSILPVNSNAISAVRAGSDGISTTKPIPSAPVYGNVKVRTVLDGSSGSPLLATGTLSFRLALWRSRLLAERSPQEWMVGEALGPNSLNSPDSGVVRADITSHSEPVEDLVRGGLVGVACILILFVLALTRRRSTPVDAWSFAVALVPFGLVYVWPEWTWVILGLCLARPLTQRS